MGFWDAIDNLFRGPSAHGDGLPFAETRLAVSGPSARYASIAYDLPSFQLGKASWPDWNVAGSGDVYRKTALVFRCLNLIAHAAGTAPLRVYDEAQDDDELPDHPLRLLVRQPNPLQGEALFWGTVALRAALAGFCVVEKERDGLGDVIALNPLRSAWLKAKPRGRGVYDWEYRVPGTDTYTLAAEDVVPFRWADTPDGSPYGLSPLATVVRDASILDKLTEFLGNLLDRGGVPQWMLFPDPDAAPMDQEGVDAWTESFLARRGGFDRRAVPWLAEGIRDAKQLSYDPTELAMTAVRDLSDIAICQAFGVPPHKAITRVGLEHTTQNATAQVEDGAFYRDTIVPLWTRFDDAATTSLLPDFEAMPTSVYLGFDRSDIEPLQEDRNEKADKLVVPGFTGGLLSNHMALRELGIPIPDGLPEFYLRGLAQEAIPAEQPIPPKPAPVQAPPQAPPNGQQGTEGLMHGVRIVQLGSGRPGPSEGYAKRKAIGAANKRLIANVAEARAPSIRRFLRQQADRVAAASAAPLGVALARSNGHAPTTYAAADIDWNAENDLLRDVLAALHRLAASTAFDAASDQIGVGIAFDLANPKVRDVLDKLGDKIVGITQQTRDHIAEIVTAGEQAGKSLADIASDIRAATAFSEGRAMRIARTESMISYNSASALAYKESGVVSKIMMLDNPAHNTDPLPPTGTTCADRDGREIGLDESDDYIASAHVNCVLAFAPVVGDD